MSAGAGSLISSSGRSERGGSKLRAGVQPVVADRDGSLHDRARGAYLVLDPDMGMKPAGPRQFSRLPPRGGRTNSGRAHHPGLLRLGLLSQRQARAGVTPIECGLRGSRFASGCVTMRQVIEWSRHDNRWHRSERGDRAGRWYGPARRGAGADRTGGTVHVSAPAGAIRPREGTRLAARCYAQRRCKNAARSAFRWTKRSEQDPGPKIETAARTSE